jgi:hypothetical protein
MRYYVTFLLLLFVPAHIVFPLTQPEESIIAERITIFNKGLPSEHPRLLITKKDIPSLRKYVGELRKTKEGAVLFKRIALEPGVKPVKGEPEMIPRKRMSRDADAARIWREGYELANDSGNYALRLAFMYLVTGEEKYARESASWLVHLSSWDVDGAISIKVNDEAFIQSCRPMIFAYDWIYPALKDEEKQVIEQALKIRLEILWKLITPKFSLMQKTEPSNSLSHPMRFISTLGQGGLALYKELPGADKYLAWAYEYYNRQFPVWGGDDGGWAEGLEYWGTGMSQHLRFLEGMQLLGYSDPLKRPFFKNNGYFGLYNMMQYPFTSFGDLANITKPNPNRSLVVEKYALMLKDPYLKAFSGKIAPKFPDGFSYYEFNAIDTLLHGYRSGIAKIKPGNLAEIPQSRVFNDIGWAVMHSALGEKDDIMLGLKSSPFGSASHSFSDQNAFVINAFGEPLAISSGYREWYDSPHHVGWTRTTASKNAILINGKGQPLKDAKATGRITQFYSGERNDFASADASPAYKENADSALRHILFVGRRYFVVFDVVTAKKPSTFQWLMHAREKMDVDESRAVITSRKGDASLQAAVIYPRPDDLKLSQTDEYAVPLDKAFRGKLPGEWHAAVSTKKETNKGIFLTALYPYKNKTENTAVFTPVSVQGGYAMRMQDGVYSSFVIAGDEKVYAVGNNISFCGLIASVHRENNVLNDIVLINGTTLSQENAVVRSDVPLSLECVFGLKGASIRIFNGAPARITLKLPFKPVKITGIPQSSITYDEKNGEITMSIARDAEWVVLNK